MDLTIYRFNDFINLVKLDNFLLNSFEFVSLMYLQGRKDKVFKQTEEYGIDFYKNQLTIYKDTNFAQYASRLHFILLTF
jgi:hypothetical protein